MSFGHGSRFEGDTRGLPGPVGTARADHDFAAGSRLQQVVWNLLSNAIKFTPDHRVIQIAVQEVNGTIEIVVSDTGQGIRDELLRSIFEPFRPGDSSTTRVTGGLVLGLSIVKYLVEAHGGAVKVESTGEGRGATFKVRLAVLPVPESTIESFRTPETSAPQESVAGVKVLIVDDDRDGGEMMTAHAVERPNAIQAMVEDAFRQAIGAGQRWLMRADDLRELQSLCVTNTCRQQVGYVIHDDDTRIMLWSINDSEESNIELAQYRFTSIKALEEMLPRYPRGTAFVVHRANQAGDVTAAISELVTFAISHGLSIKER